MKTINAFAILLDGDVKRQRVSFRDTFIGYRYIIVKKDSPANWNTSHVLYTFEPRRDDKGKKYWLIHGKNRISWFVRHVRKFNLSHLVKLHATGILPQSIVL